MTFISAHDGRGGVDHGGKTPSYLVVSCCVPRHCLRFAIAVFNAVTPTIYGEIAWDIGFAIRLNRITAMTPQFAGLRERTQSFKTFVQSAGRMRRACQAAIHRGQGWIRRRHKGFSGRGRVPRRCRGFLLTPPKGCLPPSKSSFDADEGRKPGQRRGLPARASTREFSEYIPAVKWNFFAGPLIHIDGKGIAFRRLNLYCVNRPQRIALRGQIRVGSSGEASRRKMKPAHPSGRRDLPGAGQLPAP